MSFALIDAKRAEVPVETACAVLGVSERGFYAWKTRSASARQTDDLVMLAHIRAEFSTSNETYGSPRMHAELTESGLAIGRHRVASGGAPDERKWHEGKAEDAIQEDNR